MAYYLGLDLGTSSLKALLIDERQTAVAAAHAPLSVQRPHYGWSEQDPASWVEAARGAISELARHAPHAMAKVRGIGLSGQMHGATLLDAGHTVLRPCILWNDSRAHAEAQALDDEESRAITGNIVFPGFTAPKLVWVARHEPRLRERLSHVLLPKDYLRLWLTGELLSDLSDSAGTSWLDTGARRWSARMLEKTGLDRTAMPDLVEGTQAAGRLRDEPARELGLPAGIVVAGGAGDNAASACGVGVTEPGTGFVSLGTSGVLFTPSRGYEPAPETALHTFCHAIPGLWHHMGVTLSAAGSLEWLAGVAGQTPQALAGEIGQATDEASRLLFLPYLAGERTPHNDAVVRGAFVGLSAETTRKDMTRAVMEGVAFSMRDCQEAGGGVRGDGPLIAVGAGSRSAAWLQILADVLRRDIVLPASGDFGAAFGAARLGLCAAEGAAPDDVMTMPPVASRFSPREAPASSFDAAYRRYRLAYPVIRSLMV